MFALVHPDDAPRLEEAWCAAVAANRPYSIEYRIRRPDGSISWLRTEAEAVRNSSDAPPELFGTVQDITEHKLIEEALRLNEARFSDFAETASDW